MTRQKTKPKKDKLYFVEFYYSNKVTGHVYATSLEEARAKCKLGNNADFDELDGYTQPQDLEIEIESCYSDEDELKR